MPDLALLRLPGGWEDEFWSSPSIQRFMGTNDTIGLLLGAVGHIMGGRKLEDQGARAVLWATAAAQLAQLLLLHLRPREYFRWRTRINVAQRLRFLSVRWYICLLDSPQVRRCHRHNENTSRAAAAAGGGSPARASSTRSALPRDCAPAPCTPLPAPAAAPLPISHCPLPTARSPQDKERFVVQRYQPGGPGAGRVLLAAMLQSPVLNSVNTWIHYVPFRLQSLAVLASLLLEWQVRLSARALARAARVGGRRPGPAGAGLGSRSSCPTRRCRWGLWLALRSCCGSLGWARWRPRCAAGSRWS
jgi:hypothetical protein